MQHEPIIYYLPGRGGQLSTGLGQGLRDRGFSIEGRETRGQFQTLPFDEQVTQIAYDLNDRFWTEESLVVANSFGAYLFLHAQTRLPPYIGRVLLLSPIIGSFKDEQTLRGFIPPHSELILELAKAGKMPAPKRCEVHVGSEDWQSDPESVLMLGRMLGFLVTVVPGAGHVLGKDYVGSVLDRWLSGRSGLSHTAKASPSS
jgi:predicted alpha/beta hydrolase family esterase